MLWTVDGAVLGQQETGLGVLWAGPGSVVQVQWWTISDGLNDCRYDASASAKPIKLVWHGLVFFLFAKSGPSLKLGFCFFEVLDQD